MGILRNAKRGNQYKKHKPEERAVAKYWTGRTAASNQERQNTDRPIVEPARNASQETQFREPDEQHWVELEKQEIESERSPDSERMIRTAKRPK